MNCVRVVAATVSLLVLACIRDGSLPVEPGAPALMADVAGHSPLTPIGIGGSYTITAGGDYVKAVDLAATGMQVPEGVPVRVVITGEISVTPTPGLLVFCQTEFFYPLCTGQWAELINVRSIPPSGAGIDWWPGTANILVAWNGGAATQPDAGGNSVLSGPAPAEAEVWAGREQFGCWYDDDITHTGSGACFSYGGGFTVTVRAEDGSDPGGGSGGGSGPKLSVAVDPAGVGTQGGVVTATAVLAAGATISDERWYFVPDSIATLPGDTITVPDPIVTSAPAGAASRTSGSEPGFSALSSITNLRPSSPPPLRAVAAGPGARIIHVMGSAPLGSVTACDDIESCAVPIPRGGTVVLAATVDGVALSASQHVDAGSTTAARLRLECTESVTRGQVATCAASVDPPATPFPITAWSFTPSSGSIGEIVRPGDVASTTWSGMMAAGGTLQVSATIAGATQNASATIQVEPRSPAALAVAFVISRNDPGELPARPTSEHDFGQTGFLLQVNANTIEYITDGPNTGLSFFNAVPVTVEITVSVNTVALAVGSDFWQLQDPFARPPTIGIGACNRSDVTRIIPLVEAHEGTARNSPNSHVKEYMDAFEPEARAFFEPIVAAELAGPLDDLTRISNRATAVSKQRVDNSLANPFRLNCRFKYF